MLFDLRCKYFLYGGAMAGGKSYLLRWAALSYLIYIYGKTGIKNVPVGLFSEDYPTLKDRQINRIEREFPRWLGELKDSKIDGLAFHMRPQYGGGRILLRNLDDPSKYMSTEFAGEFVDELTRDDEQTFQDLRNRLRYPGVEEVKFMGASNPGGIGHGYVKKFFINKTTNDPEQDRFFFLQANVYDNKFISPNYVKQLESLPPQQRKAYLEGSWDIFAGQFFEEWKSEYHVINPFIPNPVKTVIVGGMDWGSAKPFAFHLSTVDKVFQGEDSFFRVKTFFEMYGTQKRPEEWSEDIRTKLRVYNFTMNDILWVRADPSIFNKLNDMSKSIRDQFVDADERWRFMKPANNDREQGWQVMRQWLSLAPDGLPYWQVTSNCRNLIRTLPELIHDELHVEDVDSEGEDHNSDAMRYQFKHLKWIDAKFGAVKENQIDKRPETGFFVNKNDEGAEILLNLNKFTR